MSKAEEYGVTVEEAHGHCADLLMGDYGIPKEFRSEICEEIDKIWIQNTMIHCVIAWSVRGWSPSPATNSLKALLEKLKTHPPLNQKPSGGTPPNS